MEIDNNLFEEVLTEQRSKDGRNPRRKTYRRRVEQAYDVLIDQAKRQETIYYGELMNQIETSRGYIGPVLGGVSRLELKQDRPPLSALVLQKGTDCPGNGFCENLLADFELWESGENRETAWQRELQRVYDEWSE